MRFDSKDWPITKILNYDDIIADERPFCYLYYPKEWERAEPEERILRYWLSTTGQDRHGHYKRAYSAMTVKELLLKYPKPELPDDNDNWQNTVLTTEKWMEWPLLYHPLFKTYLADAKSRLACKAEIFNIILTKDQIDRIFSYELSINILIDGRVNENGKTETIKFEEKI